MDKKLSIKPKFINHPITSLNLVQNNGFKNHININDFLDIKNDQLNVDIVDDRVDIENNDTSSDPINENIDELIQNQINGHINELIQNHALILFDELIKQFAKDFQNVGITYNELHEKYFSKFKENHKYCNASYNLSVINTDKNNKPNNRNDLPETCELLQVLQKHEINSQVNSDCDDERSVSICSEKDRSDGNIFDETKCFARTANQKQCSRKKQKNQQFCGSHLHNQPHGRIDESTITDEIKPKKRGRPPKNTKNQQPINVVQMDVVIETINNIDYIIDNKGLIYELPKNFDQDNDIIDSEKLKLLGKKHQNNHITWYSDVDLVFIN